MKTYIKRQEIEFHSFHRIYQILNSLSQCVQYYVDTFIASGATRQDLIERVAKQVYARSKTPSPTGCLPACWTTCLCKVQDTFDDRGVEECVGDRAYARWTTCRRPVVQHAYAPSPTPSNRVSATCLPTGCRNVKRVLPVARKGTKIISYHCV